MQLVVTVSLQAEDGLDQWIRVKAYPDVPRGLSVPILMKELHDTVQDAIVIVTSKQKAKADGSET